MTIEFEKLLIEPDATVRTTVEAIDRGARQVAFVLDADKRLKAMVTDGDVRRGFLRGVSLDDPVSAIWNTDFISVKSHGEAARLMRARRLHHVPVVDADNRLVDIAVLDDFARLTSKDTRIVLMVGGLGKRLRPLTETVPKPMLPVGGKPLLEIILRNFTDQGFRNFTLSVNYKAEIVRDHFGDGGDFDADITYVTEDKPMGTAGALSLLPERPDGDFIVMNGDLLTTLNFDNLLGFHRENGAAATLCAREYTIQVPYGVVQTNDMELLGIEEKPVHRHYVNAGIYVLSPEALDLLEPGQTLDMPQLFDRAIAAKRRTLVFPLSEYWIDIGQMDDLERARADFADMGS